MIVPTRKGPDAWPACQDNADIHPNNEKVLNFKLLDESIYDLVVIPIK